MTPNRFGKIVPIEKLKNRNGTLLVEKCIKNERISLAKAKL